MRVALAFPVAGLLVGAALGLQWPDLPPALLVAVLCGWAALAVLAAALGFPSFSSAEISSSLLSAGARLESLDRLDALRIAAGIPRWGFELTEAVLPDEAGLRERGFISESKGCYIGQETVARIKTYGHVNRRLVLLSVSGGVPARENEIFFESEKTGAVTSATPAGAAGEAVALAYVKRAHANPGARFLIRTSEGDHPASIASAPVD